MAIALLNETVAQHSHSDWLEQLETFSQSPDCNSAEHQSAMDRLCLEIRLDLLELDPVYTLREWGRRRSLGI